MKRGDIYTAATGGGYGSKPRPVLIVQADVFPTVSKKLVALIGSPVEGAISVRVQMEPDATNNLRVPSEVMVDTIMTVRAEKFGTYVGRLSDADMRRVEASLMIFLGIGEVA